MQVPEPYPTSFKWDQHVMHSAFDSFPCSQTDLIQSLHRRTAREGGGNGTWVASPSEGTKTKNQEEKKKCGERKINSRVAALLCRTAKRTARKAQTFGFGNIFDQEDVLRSSRPVMLLAWSFQEVVLVCTGYATLGMERSNGDKLLKQPGAVDLLWHTD